MTTELLGKTPDRVVAYRNTDRWVQHIEPARLSPPSSLIPHPSSLIPRKEGVYLITGGLGDLGLEFAEYFARAAKANLILVSRSAVPARSEWEKWLGTHDAQDRTSTIIRKLLACEAAGGNVLVVSADVTDRRRMRTVVSDALRQFGAIHGVIHAAGTLDDGLIQLKTPKSALGVLAPKVKGTLVLDEVLAQQPLDFFVLFSSISSLLGLQGQVDYTAANAFLDAFASSRSARCAGQTVSINWSAWQAVGMAARAIRRGHDPRPDIGVTHRTHHPWLESRHEDAGAVIFVTAFSRARQWLLDEHALRGGDALIPGTGFLELARAAFVEVTDSSKKGSGVFSGQYNSPYGGVAEKTPDPFFEPVEISRVVFQAPFAVVKEETKELTLTLRSADAGWDFSMSSAGESMTHVTGHLARAPATATRQIDISALFAACDARTEVLDGHLRQSFMDFGPRWANVRRIDFGRDLALLTLELPAAFVSDVDWYALHPALLDMATGGAQPLIPGFEASRDFYVPFSYGRFVLWKGFPRRLYSHVRLRDAKTHGLALFDVTIADENGNVVAEVSDFMMKRVSHLSTEVARRDSGDAVPITSAATLAGEILRHGIAPANGIEAFERILGWGVAPQVIVSPVDPHHWLKHADVLTERSRAMALKAEQSSSATGSVSGNGEFRGDRIERALKELYSQLLGVPNVGPQDDFFELGGHSLLALRLLTRIELEFKKVIPLAKLFQTPTIEALATVLRGTETPKCKEFDIIVPFNEQGKGPPLYFVHSVTGEVVSFRHLARLLGPEQRFYGIQAPPEMQTADFASSIEAIASRYVDAIMSFQADGPCLLGGWLAGSSIALEMAQQLTAKGRTVQLLIALDGAPFNTNSGTPLYSPKYYWKLIRNFPYWITDDLLLDFSLRVLARRFRNKVLAFSERALNALRGDARHRQVNGFLDVSHFSPRLADFMNAVYDALCAYVPKPYNGRVLLYKSRSEPLYHLLEVERTWQKIAAQVDVVVVRGTHVSIVLEPYVHAVAEDLRKRLAARCAGDMVEQPLTAGQ